jgi:hypothetical protein
MKSMTKSMSVTFFFFEVIIKLRVRSPQSFTQLACLSLRLIFLINIACSYKTLAETRSFNILHRPFLIKLTRFLTRRKINIFIINMLYIRYAERCAPTDTAAAVALEMHTPNSKSWLEQDDTDIHEATDRQTSANRQ